MPKTNKYAFVFRDDGELPRLVEWLTSSHYLAAISPLHDNDHWTATDVRRYIANQERRYGVKIGENDETWERPTGDYVVVNGRRRRETETVRIPAVGEAKKAHRHIIIKYDYSLPATQVIDEFSSSGFRILYFEPIRSERAYLRYLIHLDNPEKARYRREDVVNLGGYDLKPLYEQTHDERFQITARLLDYHREHPRKSYASAIYHFKTEGDKDAVCELKANVLFWRTIFWQQWAAPK